MLSSTNLYGNTREKTGLELQRIFKTILTNNKEIINGLNEIEKVAGWYSEAKEDPKKIPSIIVNKVIEKLVDSVEKPLGDLLAVSIKTTEIKVDFVIRPYVKFIKKANGKEVGYVAITFKIVFSGRLEGSRVYSDLQGQRAYADRFIAAMTVSIEKIRASIFGFPET